MIRACSRSSKKEITMRGVLLIGVLIALLVVGALVIKNMKSDAVPENVTKQHAVEHARETAQTAQKTIDKLNKTIQQIPRK